METIKEVGSNEAVGVWVSGIDIQESLRNPLIWSACARFIIGEDSFIHNVKSPSNDKNTFMVALVDMTHTVQIFEYKVV